MHRIFEMEVYMEAVVYKTKEEHLEALRRMVGLRKVFEAQVRENRARRQDLQVAQ